MKAFVLCAGLGKRLNPISREIPKPLLPFFGKTPLFFILQKLKEIKIKEVGINLHHMPEEIKNYLKNFKYFKFHFFFEKKLLDTGGALKNAKNFLSSSKFFVLNCDLIFKFSLKEILDFHNKNGNLCTLVITDFPNLNNIEVNEKGELINISKGVSKNLKTFTGIALYEPKILDFMEMDIFSIKQIWLKLIKEGIKINTYFIKPELCIEIGTLKSYAKALFEKLKSEGEKNYLSSPIKSKNIKLYGFNIIEKSCKISKNIKLKNCIILPNSLLKENQRNKIIGRNFKIPIPLKVLRDGFFSKDKFLKNFTKKDKIYLKGLTEGGSLRNFYHFGKKYVFLKSLEEDKEFERWFQIRKLFSSLNLPVPKVLKISYKEKKAIIEHCGEYSLYDFSKFLPEKEIYKYYKNVLNEISKLHRENLKKYLGNKIFKGYIFEKNYFLWETNYFYENFIKNYLKLNLPYGFFKRDFEKLAEISSTFEKRIIHRDLQSKNIIIKRGVCFIDFQSARLGPTGYDIASLLWDPYLPLPKNLREKLLFYYKEIMGKDLPLDFDKSLIYLRLQRHFQALGAYSFLSLIRKKENFLKFINPSFKILKEDIKEAPYFNSFTKILEIKI